MKFESKIIKKNLFLQIAYNKKKERCSNSMDEVTYKFPCSVVNPRVFPAPLLTWGGPYKVKVNVEIGDDNLSFLSHEKNVQSKVLGSESYDKISTVDPRLLSKLDQLKEVVIRSLTHMGIIGVIAFLYLLFLRRYVLNIAILGGGFCALIAGALFFLFNGGVSIKTEIYRFYFYPKDESKPFYLELEASCETELLQALKSIGLKIGEGDEKAEELECSECSAFVDTTATKCPYCGADFNE